VLSEFGRRIGGTYSSQEVLPEMVQIVAAGTGAGQVVVWLRVDDELRPEASSDCSRDMAPLPVSGHDVPSMPGTDLSVPVLHGVICWARSRSGCPRVSRCGRPGSSW
jgi:hypothetical protein